MTTMTSTTRRRRIRNFPTLLVLVGPFALLFVVFFVAPIVYAIVQSLFATQTSGLGFGPPQ